MPKDKRTDEDLIRDMSQWNERAPDRWRAHFELERRAAEKAGKPTFIWTVIGAIAALVAAVTGIIALLK